MQHFPIFVNLRAQSVVVVGGGDAALAKLRLLLKTEAQITVFAPHPARQIAEWAEAGALTLINRHPIRADLTTARLVYAAEEDAARDAKTAELAAGTNALLNIVDNLADSQFITPAIVDRDPVTIAIGTEGTAPVLARRLKADFEARLPTSLGPLARAAAAFRIAAEALPRGRARRDFWNDVFFAFAPKQLRTTSDAETRPLLDKLLASHLNRRTSPGQITFTAAPGDDPDLLTLRARNALAEADVVVHDASIHPAHLDLARREAIFIRVDHAGDAPHLARLLTTHGQKGAYVIRLSNAEADATAMHSCHMAGLTCHHIPHVPIQTSALQKEIA